ncbi:MAG: hypothetical protein HFH75_11930 [Lachnospiraceae bacterium]|jgi:hypothetical protein|nr:hypothetical protein [Lachnospiraceae bacterium]
MNNNILKSFYEYMEKKNYPIDAQFVFVYNDYSTYADDPHLEECFDEDEVHEILDSVSDIFKETIALGSEKEFLNWLFLRKCSDKKIYVYTMAQYVNGFGRRALIPALCQYYGLINLNADTYMSTIGCNKETMFKLLLANNLHDILVPTIFINTFQSINFEKIISTLGKHIIIKPICESCCIDVIILKDYTINELNLHINTLLQKYGHVMIQKYVFGEEIGITVFFHNNEMYTLTPIQMVFSSGKTHLTHTDSYYENYQLKTCNVPIELLEMCKKMSYLLKFHCITRYDFRFDGTNFYLFDLSPNPTINGYTSSNLAAQSTLQCDHRGIMRLMAYDKIALFEPSFNCTK